MRIFGRSGRSCRTGSTTSQSWSITHGKRRDTGLPVWHRTLRPSRSPGPPRGRSCKAGRRSDINWRTSPPPSTRPASGISTVTAPSPISLGRVRTSVRPRWWHRVHHAQGRSRTVRIPTPKGGGFPAGGKPPPVLWASYGCPEPGCSGRRSHPRAHDVRTTHRETSTLLADPDRFST
jgi:hypothetical protein